MELTETEKTFILHWGEMGGRWGINRAVAQVQAVLLLSERPLHAQEICEALTIARSNVSVALKELQSWGIVKLVHVMGDRREHFEADKDAWTVLSKVAERRVELEILPTVKLLRELTERRDTRAGPKGMFSDFADVLESGVKFYRSLRILPQAAVKRILKLGSKLEQITNRY